MFAFCSIWWSRGRSRVAPGAAAPPPQRRTRRLAGFRRARRLAGFLLLLVALLAGPAAPPGAQQMLRVEDKGVQQRMAVMALAKSSVGVLAEMMAGRVRFDPEAARAARRNLVRAMGAVPGRFRRPHADPLSHASPLIWRNWEDFRQRARTARRAAQGLETGSLNRLRRSLPGLMRQCLECHRAYRLP